MFILNFGPYNFGPWLIKQFSRLGNIFFEYPFKFYTTNAVWKSLGREYVKNIFDVPNFSHNDD